MKLRDVDFNDVFLASGVLNFYKEGYPHHKIYKFIPGFDLNGATFISKTITWLLKEGNMPLKENFQPKELMPSCIKIYPIEGITLNSVGLSGPGMRALLRKNRWQMLPENFLISFMAVGDTPAERLDETTKAVDLLGENLSDFKAEIGLVMNISCPNTKHKPDSLIKEAVPQLEIANKLGIPLVIKLNALTAIEAVKEICNSGFCDAVECSNTIPFGELPTRINWEHLFSSTVSPLAHLGGGGLSGWPLIPIVVDWIKAARDDGVTIPIIAGGGIGCRKLFGKDYEEDIRTYKKAGANGVVIGIAALIRPLKIEAIIKYASNLFREETI